MASGDEINVGARLEAQRRERRERIEKGFWPKARLLGEIFYQQINRNNTFSLAAALTYKTLFSLLPVFVLTLLILSSIPMAETGAGSESALDRSVRQVIFEQLSLDKLPVTGANGVPLMDPGTQREVTAAQLVSPMIEKAKRSITTTAAGLVALVVVLYSAITLIITIEGAFNQIYGTAQARGWWRRLIMYFCALIIAPLGIAGSVLLGREAFKIATNVAGVGALMSVIVVFMSAVVSWVVVLLLFKVIPHTRVKWRSAMLGAAVAAVSWEVSKWGFDVYTQTTLKHSWYGSLVLLPLFMTWIYLTWSVILMGLEVSYLHQYYPMLKRHFFSTRGMARFADVRWILVIGILMYQRHKEDRGLRADQAAKILMIPNDVTERLLAALLNAGLVKTSGNDAYRFATAPEKITAYDLLVAGRAFCHVPPELSGDAGGTEGVPMGGALRELEELQEKWAQGHTLPELAGDK